MHEILLGCKSLVLYFESKNLSRWQHFEKTSESLFKNLWELGYLSNPNFSCRHYRHFLVLSEYLISFSQLTILKLAFHCVYFSSPRCNLKGWCHLHTYSFWTTCYGFNTVLLKLFSVVSKCALSGLHLLY